MEQQQTVALPELVSPAFRELIRGASPKAAEALKREVYFSAAEDVAVDFEAEDPLGERYYRATDWSVHQYPNRLLVLTTGRCLSYCRYCFRREFTARELGFLSDAEWDAVLDYVAAHPQITEILLSGGDPLSMPFEVFRRVLLKIRSRFKNLLIRVCTRVPIFAPELFTQLVALGVKPGYLFQLDTARGTSHFAVPFRDALAIWAKLRNMLSGLSRPEFAVDLLDGGGKFSLSAVSLHDDIMEITETGFKVRRSDGKVYHYK